MRKAQWVSLRASSLSTAPTAGGLAGLDRSPARPRCEDIHPRDERVLGLVAGIDTRRRLFLSEGPSRNSCGFSRRLRTDCAAPLRQFLPGDGVTIFPPADGRSAAGTRRAFGDPEAGDPAGRRGASAGAVAVAQPAQFPLRLLGGEVMLLGITRALRPGWRIRFDVNRHFMVPGGSRRVSISVFTEAGSAWDNAPRHWYKDAGTELL